MRKVGSRSPSALSLSSPFSSGCGAVKALFIVVENQRRASYLPVEDSTDVVVMSCALSFKLHLRSAVGCACSYTVVRYFL